MDTTINLDTVHSVAILGGINEGKTNLAFYYLNEYRGVRTKYLFGYPAEVAGCKALSSWEDLVRVQDGIIFIDEIQRYVKVYDRRANEQLMELLAMMAHKNNTLIFTTQLSQFITRGVEGLIECWAIKRIDLETLKNGSKPKRIIERLVYPRKNQWMLDLDKDAWFEYSERNGLGENRVKHFPFQGVGKDWRNPDKNSDKKRDENSEKNSEEKVASTTLVLQSGRRVEQSAGVEERFPRQPHKLEHVGSNPSARLDMGHEGTAA